MNSKTNIATLSEYYNSIYEDLANYKSENDLYKKVVYMRNMFTTIFSWHLVQTNEVSYSINIKNYGAKSNRFYRLYQEIFKSLNELINYLVLEIGSNKKEDIYTKYGLETFTIIIQNTLGSSDFVMYSSIGFFSVYNLSLLDDNIDTKFIIDYDKNIINPNLYKSVAENDYIDIKDYPNICHVNLNEIYYLSKKYELNVYKNIFHSDILVITSDSHRKGTINYNGLKLDYYNDCSLELNEVYYHCFSHNIDLSNLTDIKIAHKDYITKVI